MGIDGYLTKRKQIESQFGDKDKQFKGRMRTFVDAPAARDNMIFTHDIKNLLHLCDSNRNDIDLLIKVLQRYCTQSDGIFTENYHFSTVLMRLLNLYKLDDVALKVIDYYN